MEDVNEIYRKIGKNLKKYRELKGFSQEELAERLDANPKYVGHVERFERYVGLKKLIKLSFILEIELKDLFDFQVL
jgi:transcriptional regulator with XRE-family HTH domain